MSNAPDPGPHTTRPSGPTAQPDRVSAPPPHWPTAQEFNEAIQNLAYSMSDVELRGGEPTVNKLGLPMPYSGGVADIYRVHCPATGNTWAVKCFTRGASGLRQRYAAISRHLQSVRLPYMADFDYIDHGVRVGAAWYPIVKMRWVEGLTLNAFVAQSLQHPATLDRLFELWMRLAKSLRQAEIAHADLQHGNVLLLQHPETDQLDLRLIDYDGMYVPALAGQRSGELGHPAFQHPQRLREGTYDLHVDRFSHLAICCALRALRVGGRSLWDRYDNGDNLLFRARDFAAPLESDLFQELDKLRDPVVQILAGRLALAALARIDQTPAIDELLDDGWMSWMSTDVSPHRHVVVIRPSPDPPAPVPTADEAVLPAASDERPPDDGLAMDPPLHFLETDASTNGCCLLHVLFLYFMIPLAWVFSVYAVKELTAKSVFMILFGTLLLGVVVWCALFSIVDKYLTNRKVQWRKRMHEASQVRKMLNSRPVTPT